MKIRPKTKVLPKPSKGEWGRHAKLWAAVCALDEGEYLPVECSNDQEARNLYATAHTHRTHIFDCHRRKLTVYLAYKGARNGDNVPEAGSGDTNDTASVGS